MKFRIVILLIVKDAQHFLEISGFDELLNQSAKNLEVKQQKQTSSSATYFFCIIIIFCIICISFFFFV